MKKRFGIYEVHDYLDSKGEWCGYRCSVVDDSGKKQGKLYIKSDGRENYKAKPKDEDLEI